MFDPASALAPLHPGLRNLPPRFHQALRESGQEDHLLVFAWELARLPEPLEERSRRSLFALALALLVAEGHGHVRMPLRSQEGDAAWAFLKACGQGSLELPDLLEHPAIAPLVGSPGEARPLILEEGWLYLFRLHRAETRLAQSVRNLLEDPPLAVAPPPETLYAHPVVLSREQRAAVETALARPLALVTGGPGTGKTSIVVALLRALLHQPGADPTRIALAAPTGKAAQRMGEALRKALDALDAPDPADQRLRTELPEPRTLHRLLGWNPALARFRHDESHPLEAQVVIVDEASMISLELMDQLFRARAAGTRLVLLGDADQLPSVEAGCAFRDLVSGLPDTVQRLTESYRMRAGDPAGRHVLLAAQSIHRGEVPDGDLIPLRNCAADLLFEGVERLEDDVPAALERWFREVVMADDHILAPAHRIYGQGPHPWAAEDLENFHALVQASGRARILCALKDTGDARGVEGLNALFHQWMQPQTGQGLRGGTPFYAGEPVLMSVNDPRRGLFNGDVGVVLKVVFGDEVRQAAVFPSLEGPRAFPVEALRGALQLCHAMTIHKAQGSEFDRVLLLLPQGAHRALSREILYTGLTRAKRSVTLLAEAASLSFAIQTPEQRSSNLHKRLSDANSNPRTSGHPS